jgi:hypothetical protein
VFSCTVIVHHSYLVKVTKIKINRIKKVVSAMPVGLKYETRWICIYSNQEISATYVSICKFLRKMFGFVAMSVTVCGEEDGFTFLPLYFNTHFRSCFTKQMYERIFVSTSFHWTWTFTDFTYISTSFDV